MIDAIAGNALESKAFVEALRRVEGFDVDGYGASRAFAFGEYIFQDSRADAASAKDRQQGNIHDANFAFATMDVKATGCLTLDHDDLEIRTGVFALVELSLGLELH